MRRITLSFAFVSALALCGCAINSDGSITPGFRTSRLWQERAPQKDIEAYYDQKTFDELCEIWWLTHRSGSPMDVVGDKNKRDAFARRGKSPADCPPGRRGD